MALARLDLDSSRRSTTRWGTRPATNCCARWPQRLELELRPATAGRLGGDEFAVVALIDPRLAIDGAAVGLGTGCTSGSPRRSWSGASSCTRAVSVGVTTIDAPDRASDAPAQLLREADVAMYDAKRSGSGSPCTTARGTPKAAAPRPGRRDADRADPRAARAAPPAAAGRGHRRTVGVEALVRWAHPTRGLLVPGDFLPLAEVHGLMGALTEET